MCCIAPAGFRAIVVKCGESDSGMLQDCLHVSLLLRSVQSILSEANEDILKDVTALVNNARDGGYGQSATFLEYKLTVKIVARTESLLVSL